MAVKITRIVLENDLKVIEQESGPIKANIEGSGFKLSSLKAGFVDAYGNVVEEYNIKNELQLTIEQPDSDYVLDDRFPIVVEAFEPLPVGNYKVFVRAGNENLSNCWDGEEETTRDANEEVGDGCKSPADNKLLTCFVFPVPIEVTPPKP